MTFRLKEPLAQDPLKSGPPPALELESRRAPHPAPEDPEVRS